MTEKSATENEDSERVTNADDFEVSRRDTEPQLRRRVNARDFSVSRHRNNSIRNGAIRDSLLASELAKGMVSPTETACRRGETPSQRLAGRAASSSGTLDLTYSSPASLTGARRREMSRESARGTAPKLSLKSPTRTPRAPLQAGDLLPRTRILLKGEAISLRDFFQQRRGVLFGGPGAFIPTCSDKHLTGFRDQASEIKKAGIDFIGCIYANDPYVLKAWARARRIQDQFTFISDVEGRLASALGLLNQLRTRGLGIRPRRFAMVIGYGGQVEWIGLDEICFVENVLDFLGVAPAPVTKSMASMEDSQITPIKSPQHSIAGDAATEDSEQVEEEDNVSSDGEASNSIEELRPDDFSSQELMLGRWRSLLLEASVRVDNLMRIPLKTLNLGPGLGNDDTIQIAYNIRPKQHTISHTPRCLRVSADTVQGFEGFGHLRYEGKNYLATEFHLVGPSPHMLGDKPSFRRPVELRIVHQVLNQHKESNKSQLLVVAVTFNPPPLTASERDNVLAINPFIHQILEIPTLTASTYEVFQVGRRALQGEGFDLQSLFHPDSKFLKYSGVLSALGERVIWVVMKEALSLSRPQLHCLERFLLTPHFTVEDPSDAYVTSFVYRFLPKLKNIRAASGNIIIESLRKKMYIMSKLDQTLSSSAYEALGDAKERGVVAKWLFALQRKMIEKQRENNDLKGLIERALEAFPIEQSEKREVMHGRQLDGQWYTTYLDTYLGGEDSQRLLDFVNKFMDLEPDDGDDLGEETPNFARRNSSVGLDSFVSMKRSSITSVDARSHSQQRSATVQLPNKTSAKKPLPAPASPKRTSICLGENLIRDREFDSSKTAPSSRAASLSRVTLRRAATTALLLTDDTPLRKQAAVSLSSSSTSHRTETSSGGASASSFSKVSSSASSKSSKQSPRRKSQDTAEKRSTARRISESSAPSVSASSISSVISDSNSNSSSSGSSSTTTSEIIVPMPKRRNVQVEQKAPSRSTVRSPMTRLKPAPMKGCLRVSTPEKETPKAAAQSALKRLPDKSSAKSVSVSVCTKKSSRSLPASIKSKPKSSLKPSTKPVPKLLSKPTRSKPLKSRKKVAAVSSSSSSSDSSSSSSLSSQSSSSENSLSPSSTEGTATESTSEEATSSSSTEESSFDDSSRQGKALSIEAYSDTRRSTSSNNSRRQGDDLNANKFLTEERVELVNFMLKQLKRSSSAESTDDVTSANTAANCRATKMTEAELSAAERKQKALKKLRKRGQSGAIRFAISLDDEDDKREEWNQDDRKISREFRLRQRKPTGHPALGQQVAKMLRQMASEGPASRVEDSDTDGGKFEPASLTAQPKKGALKKPIKPPSDISLLSEVRSTPSPNLPTESMTVKRHRQQSGSTDESSDSPRSRRLLRPKPTATKKARRWAPSSSSSSTTSSAACSSSASAADSSSINSSLISIASSTSSELDPVSKPDRKHPAPKAKNAIKEGQPKNAVKCGQQLSPLSPTTRNHSLPHGPTKKKSLTNGSKPLLNSEFADSQLEGAPPPTTPLGGQADHLSRRLCVKSEQQGHRGPASEPKKSFGRLRGRMASMKTPDEAIKIDHLRNSLVLEYM